MPDFSTELTAALLDKIPIEEFFRRHLETAINAIIQMEQDAFSGYEKYASKGWNSGNSRNGSYTRVFHTKYGALNIVIPRDRNGLFHQQTIPKYRRSSESLETAIIQLYGKGITTREIGDLIEKMYGHYYTPQTVSNMAQRAAMQAKEFHSRPVADRFAVIYCDATYINLRRDSVAKEALHVIQGITPDGQKEVLDYAICPTEAAENYVELLRGLKERGLRQVLFFVSDGLGGLADALKAEYMIENNNKGLKHRAKLKEQFPNEESLDRFACAYYSDCNQKAAGKAHKGFKEAASVLLEMFSSLEAFFCKSLHKNLDTTAPKNILYLS